MTGQTNVGNMRDWVNLIGTNSTGVSTPSNILVNGTASGVSNGGSSNMTLAINLGRTAEASDFEISQLIIWDQALTAAEMVIVSNAITYYMSSGSLQ
jgi:hypothetical protein